MSGRKLPSGGPTPNELRLKAELDKARRDLSRLKKSSAAQAPEPAPAAAPAPAPAAVPSPDPESELRHAPPGSPEETAALRRLVGELTATRQRLSQLYFTQVEENRKRGRRLHEILESLGRISSERALEPLVQRLAETVREGLGFRIVLVRLREPGTDRLRTRACAGLEDAAAAGLDGSEVGVEEFRGWLQDEHRVSRSYFISHRHGFDKPRAAGRRPALGPREDWEWHEDDVLLVPLEDRAGELVGYLSVDDPEDRLVPSSETIELLEIVGNHAVAAIENARLYRELEAQACELRESGQRAQELHALKGNFLQTISHELRTPLTAIRAYLDTLLSFPAGELPGDRLRHFLGIINEESQRLARLIESVLDLNRLDSGEMRLERLPVELGAVVEDTVRLLGPVAEAGQVAIKLVNDCADTTLDADLDQMRQLVLHLGSNAVKFTPEGGSVTVFLSGKADEIALRVEDTGIGIPEEALERVFERFYQVDSSLVRRYGGTGLGLAICKSIVEWHGGRITAESAPGRGSCFTVVMPRRSRPRVALRPDPDAPAAAGDLLRLAIEMVAEIMDARIVSLLAPGPDGDLCVRAAIGLDESVVREARIPAGTGVAGWVAKNRRPVCVSDAQESSEIAGSGRSRYRSRTFISVPLEGEDELLGVLSVTDPVSGKPFDAQDCELLLQLADRVAATWGSLRHLEDGAEGAADTARALRQMLVHLERGRFEAPGRVRLARLVAEEMGLGESETATLSFAASVHDIGMSRLPGSLRGSAGEFSADERAMMERHVELGAELLGPLEAVGAVRAIVLSHHEWWDGTGYPRGLRGEEIPVGARILAVVDAWESMIVGRAHRPARTEGEARQELRRLVGRQFDSRVVEAFERVLDGTARVPQSAPETRGADGPTHTEDANAIARR